MFKILHSIEIHGSTVIYGDLYVKGDIIVENDVKVIASGDVICYSSNPVFSESPIHGININENALYINGKIETNPAKIGLYILQNLNSLTEKKTKISKFNELFEI